jgi:hypothetical protein
MLVHIFTWALVKRVSCRQACTATMAYSISFRPYSKQRVCALYAAASCALKKRGAVQPLDLLPGRDLALQRVSTRVVVDPTQQGGTVKNHSPNFLHFVGLDRGSPGLPYGMARVTRRSTATESLTQSSNTFGDSKLARQPEMCRGQSNTTGVMSSFCCPYVLSMSLYTEHELTCNNVCK